MMRIQSLLYSILAAVLLLAAGGCSRPSPATACEDTICTEIFMAVMVQVSDTAGNPVQLDEYYTLRGTERLPAAVSPPENGRYVVVDDRIVASLANKTETFRFVGKKNGAEVVNEQYQVRGDCCHVHKEQGKDQVVIP
ncbi:MAG: hypothetical protein JNL72_02385 [Flavipsychrobacter sp.]|nr:hypothetical protein [Flavipsychrobacter sp.]